MFLEQETKDKFGYTFESISSKSNKKIVCKCDYCQNEYDVSKKNRQISWEKFPKDCCFNCRHHKRSEMSIAEHGVSNPFQRKDVKEKTKKTNLEKYGHEYANQSEQVKTKIRKSTKDRFGVEHIMQNLEMCDQIKKTMMDKYGAENPSNVPELVEKRKQTMIERFGTPCYYNSEQCKQNIQDKYGVDNVFQLEEVKQKSKITNLERYGCENSCQNPEIAQKIKEKSLQTKKDKGLIDIRDGKTRTEWSDELNISRSYFSHLVNEHGWDYAIKFDTKTTNIELIIKEILEENNIEYIFNRAFEKYMPDFRIESHKLIIEPCGLYFHSDKIQEDNNYHVKKKEFYDSKGYKSLFFWSDEVENKKDIVKSIINNKLGLSKKYQARKLKIDSLENGCSSFFNENHLMGNGAGVVFVLKDSDEIISAMQFRRKKGRSWEISRFCNKIGTSCVGAFTRLISSFIKTYSPESLITFVDRRYGDGDYLTGFGFVLHSCHKSFKWTNGRESLHRMNFPSNTGYENGYAKIWDCGQSKYMKVY